jgi:hypothetical protein
MRINGSLKEPLKKTHMFSLGYFDVYFYDENLALPSYVFTKGIPFAPLITFYGRRIQDIRIEINTGIILNIRHGGFTPVQTRTRLNMEESAAKDFELLLSYIVTVKLLKSLKSDLPKYSWMYSNFTSKAPIDSLGKMFERSIGTTDTLKISQYFSYLNFDLLETKKYSSVNTLTYYTNKLSDHFKGKAKIDKSDTERIDLNKAIAKLQVSPYPPVNELVQYALSKWFYTKNSTGKKNEKNAKTVKMRDVKPDVRDTKLEPIIKCFIETFRDLAVDIKINGWKSKNLTKINVVKSEEEESILGYYTPASTSIMINTLNLSKIDQDEFIRNIKNVKSPADFGKITGKVWDDYFKYRYPASTCIHELEHARRASSHLDAKAPHDTTIVSLWEGDSKIERTFDQSANEVYSKIIQAGFYENLFSNFKKLGIL